ncbi:hypothetical protein [Flavobacterium sp.]|uniref:hypothetical protein n=1 Tax=Flavobacterium sp. TaxID=239 RepID=UPI003D1244C3
MEKQKIYVLHSASVIGMLGPETETIENKICAQCAIVELPFQYKNVHLYLDSWNAEDLIQSGNLFLVSDQLKVALTNHAIKGCAFEKIEVTKSEYFYSSNVNQDNLPQYWQLQITSRCKGPEVWWERIPCGNCDKTKWKITNAGIVSISVPFNTDAVPTRKVYFDSWTGEDIFYLEDPDVPIITEKFLEILKQFNCEMNILESDWEN